MFLDFANSNYMCIWLKGEDLNVDIVWQYCDFSFVNIPNAVENMDLFDAKNYKTKLNKENKAFLKSSNRENWNTRILIKNFDAKILNKNDVVIDLDKMPKKKLFEQIKEFHSIQFDDVQWAFVLQFAKNLKELIVCSMLQSCAVDMENWNEFLSQVQEGWYKKLVNNELIGKAIVEDNAIAIMQYILKSPYNPQKKAVLQFIASNIKDGQRVWHLNSFWKALV